MPLDSFNTSLNSFLEKGWVKFEEDPKILRWIEYALPYARASITQAENAQWFRNNNTWFVGVNALPNDHQGRIGNSQPIDGRAIDFVKQLMQGESFCWDRGQISICYPGYPKRWEGETEAAHQYRVKRHAAHIDGISRDAEQQRFLNEHHAFILGIPLLTVPVDASPTVVWESSHHLVRRYFEDLFRDISPAQWKELTITKEYNSLRKELFEQCNRIELPAKPGECYVIHRLALHGMAAWRGQKEGFAEGRMICYFRPELDGSAKWLSLP